ncbi:MAG: hypothetical protein QM536_08410 [Chitinophagaceae bacterium]|nr:hypothetical protein [Chitinophagaceae bacterium]
MEQIFTAHLFISKFTLKSEYVTNVRSAANIIIKTTDIPIFFVFQTLSSKSLSSNSFILVRFNTSPKTIKSDSFNQ